MEGGEDLKKQQNIVFLDKSAQYNTFKYVLKDLEKQLDVLYREKKVGEKEKEGVKVLNFERKNSRKTV